MRFCRICLPIALTASLLAAPLLACEWPLTSESIREAYEFGRKKNVKTALFLKRYLQEFPAPKVGPHIAVIRLETPYAAVVRRSGESPNYETQDAEKEFLGKPGTLRFTVRIDFTRSYTHIVSSSDPNEPPQERSPDFWRDFQIRVMQGDTEIPPDKISGTPSYASDSTNGVAPLDGAMVALEFDAAKIHCVPTTIDLLTPDGQHIQAPFDLAKLR